MTQTKRCPKCERTLAVEQFGWRDAAHTTRQGWCKECLRPAIRAARRRPGRDGSEHLRNHFETGVTVCGKGVSQQVAAHYYDEDPSTQLPTCPTCLVIDEQACLEADFAQHQPRGPLDTNPYRQTYIAVVDRLTHKE